MPKKVSRIFFSIFLLILLSLLFLIGVLHFTPTPLFRLINLVPWNTVQTKPRDYSAIEEGIKVEKNVSYSNDYPKSRLDIYCPKEMKEKLPVIIFIHGGGFFKGEKEMARFFGPTLANSQYVFVSVDYNLAPDSTIFDQVKQINEALHFIVYDGEKYGMDSKKINLSGSSAGGFLALQLLSAYHDESYGKTLGIQPINDLSLRSLLLYSSVYDLSKFQQPNQNKLVDYLMTKTGWGITGEKNWRADASLGRKLNLNNFISEDFPPIFITDGNYQTFTTQAKEYADNLKKTGNNVETLFFDSNEQIGHGYQLKMDTVASEQAIKASSLFLEKWNK